MACAACGFQSPANAQFCLNCGTPLVLVCPACGEFLPSESVFCFKCGARLAPIPASQTPASAIAPPLPTSFANGRYTVKRFLGEGGKKRVYLVHDTKLDREVAFSLIKTAGLDAVGVERIEREARLMGKLGGHPNIVALFDMGEEAGQPYLVSELMGDVDLEQLVIDSALGLDEEAQKANIGQIAKAFNELLPALPMYERYGANPRWEGVRVKVWPADDDPILKNSPYGDGIPTMLLYTGRLEPV